ncbi:hypothetical protein VP06_17805 [Methylobacterium aquaticum]|uniref:Uncharacterized protein n=1 Tax=Methylobacterium aquaticum TaxID=270351 RepID=A0A0J6SF77_9HYPH|nr:hypothetical protein VP06_17805 [Methylobacterium aquaticum]
MQHLMDQVRPTPQSGSPVPPQALQEIGPPRVAARIIAVKGDPVVADTGGEFVSLSLAQFLRSGLKRRQPFLDLADRLGVQPAGFVGVLRPEV